MGATNHTTNYNLPQFVGSDKPTWLGDVNGAMLAIDTQMKSNNTLANTAKTTADNAGDTASSAISTANTASATATTASETATQALNKALEVESALGGLLQLVFPVGSTYITQSADTNPNDVLGFGTWTRFKGRVAIGVDENDNDFATVGYVGGEKSHRLTVEEIPSHTHSVTQNSLGASDRIYVSTGSGNSVGNPIGEISIGLTGGNNYHNNMQPYEVVGYMWKRTA